MDRTKAVTLLSEALTFGTNKQKRVLRNLLDEHGLTIEDLITDFNPASDATLIEWVMTVGYGIDPDWSNV